MRYTDKRRIISLLEWLCGKALPIIFWVSIIFGFDVPYMGVLTILTAILHEMGHIFALIIFGDKDVCIRGHLSGFRIRMSKSPGYIKQIAIYAGGPLLNIILFLTSMPFFRMMSGYIEAFAYVNLATAISNLLPIEGYDGYNILCEIAKYKESDSALNLLSFISFLATAVLTFISLYLIDKFGSGYWIFGIFFFLLISKISKITKNNIFEE